MVTLVTQFLVLHYIARFRKIPVLDSYIVGINKEKHGMQNVPNKQHYKGIGFIAQRHQHLIFHTMC